jgi:hypothetical protein
MVSVETRGSTATGRTDSEAPHERSAHFLFFIYMDMIVQTPSRQRVWIFTIWMSYQMGHQLTIS